MTRQPNIVVDSGAYSAWRLGKPIDLKEYCRYLKENQDWISHYIALDIIMPNDRETASVESWNNLMTMRKQGLDPVPVFHIGEDIKWLFKLLDLGCEYIAVSNSSMRMEDRADDFYSFIWSHLVTSDGLPIIKLHALGEGRAKQLKSYPWQSSDSTSWVYAAARTGTIMLPTGHVIGMRKDKASTKSQPDFSTLSATEKAVFDGLMSQHQIDQEAFVEGGPIGMTIRSYLTALYYLQLNWEVNDLNPIRFQPKGFLTKTIPGQPVEIDFKLHLVHRCLTYQYPIMHKLGDPPSLASFFYIQQTGNKKGMYLGDYIRDPEGYIEKSQIATRYWNILEKYVK